MPAASGPGLAYGVGAIMPVSVFEMAMGEQGKHVICLLVERRALPPLQEATSIRKFYQVRESMHFSGENMNIL